MSAVCWRTAMRASSRSRDWSSGGAGADISVRAIESGVNKELGVMQSIVVYGVGIECMRVHNRVWLDALGNCQSYGMTTTRC